MAMSANESGLRRAARILIVVWLVLGMVVASASASHLSNTVEVNGPTPIVAPNGPNVTITGTANVSLTDAFPDSITVEIISDEGNATFISAGPTNATVAATEINGTWTNVSDLDISTNELYVDPGDKAAFNVSGDADSVSVHTTITADDGAVDFVYAGTSGTTTVTVRGLPADTTVEAVDADTGTVLATDTTDGSGTAIFSTMPNSEHDVEIQSTSGGGGGAGATGGYEIESAKFIRDQSVAPTSPQSVTFNGSGTKMYVASTVNDELYEYTLSDPFNISSATFSQSTDVGGVVNNPTDIAFNADGSKMFTTSFDGVVRGYSLSTPYDISTASLSESHDVSSKESRPHGLAFNGTGTKLFITGDLNDTVEEYSLSSNFAVSTASHAQTLDVSGQVTDPSGVAFNESGSSIFLTGGDAAIVYKYNLSADFDISTADLNTSIDISTETGEASGIAFNPNGTHMFLADREGSFTGLDIDDYEIVSYAPAVDNGSASPTGGLSSSQQTLSIDVNDSDFPDINSDSVDVEFFVGGSSVGTDTLIANRTADQSHTFNFAGETDWWVVATDSDGQSTRSQNFTVTTETNVTFREESEPHSIIDSTEIRVTFYELGADDPVIVNRSTTDGAISLTGLPTGTDFAMNIKAEGYHNRTILIESLTNQENIFLLNESVPSVENRFIVVDRTGDFPAGETRLIVQKAINQSLYDASAGTNQEWLTVAGDELGSSQSLTNTLLQDDRYRIVVENEDGDRRVLGAYVARTTGTIEFEIGQVIADPEADQTIEWDAYRTNSSGTVTITFEYNDSTQNTDELWVEMYERGNESNVLFANTSFAGPMGTQSVTQTVPQGERDNEWVIRFYADRDGEDAVGQTVVGPTRGLLGDLDPWVKTLISIGTIWVVAGLFSQLNGDVGALAIAGLAGLFWFVEFLPPETSDGVVVLAMITAGVIFIRERRESGAGL